LAATAAPTPTVSSPNAHTNFNPPSGWGLVAGRRVISVVGCHAGGCRSGAAARDPPVRVTQGECLSWLVTRFADGIIHVEAPVKRDFTLGEFFDVWGQPLGHDVAGAAHGPVTAIVNGSVWTGDPRSIPLREHTQIQLEVGRPLIAPETITFPGSY
jgi:hypothetical protein